MIGLFISASLLSFGDTIKQAPAPTSSTFGNATSQKYTVTRTYTLSPERVAFFATSKAYDPINKPETLEPMCDAVMGRYHTHKVDPAAAKLLKPIWSKLEVDYWRGQNQGIDEADIVNLVNTFADNQQLPEIAKTTQSQVHHLRMLQALNDEPYFTGKGVRLRKNADTGEITTASTNMSPLQAFHLVQVLIDMKIVSEEYQKTPADWEIYLSKVKTNLPPHGHVIHGYTSAGNSLNDNLRRIFNTMKTTDAVTFVSKFVSGVNSR